ncbi:hypothetical protein MIR68_001719 [Amoeboaphelidium protococcarum]|nr:hypothetical protein MIR68_001719 [Amoeboaphelidium protococcarum]
MTDSCLSVTYHLKDIPLWTGLVFKFDDSLNGGSLLEAFKYAIPLAVRHAYRRLPQSYEEDSSKFCDKLDKALHTQVLLHHHLSSIDKQIQEMQLHLQSINLVIPEDSAAVAESKATAVNFVSQSSCRRIFVAKDAQFKCMLRPMIVCVDYSQYRLVIQDVLSALSTSDVSTSNRDSFKNWRACEKCVTQVVKNTKVSLT